MTSATEAFSPSPKGRTFSRVRPFSFFFVRGAAQALAPRPPLVFSIPRIQTVQALLYPVRDACIRETRPPMGPAPQLTLGRQFCKLES